MEDTEPWRRPLAYGPWETAILLLTPLLLLPVYRFPVTVFLATLPCAYVWYLQPSLFALYVMAAKGRGLVAVAGYGLLGATFWTSIHYEGEETWLGTTTRVWEVGSFVAIPVVIGLLNRAWKRSAARLAALEESRERESRLLTLQVLSAERDRIAREMHDIVAHQVSLTYVQAGALEVTTGDPAAREVACAIRDRASRTLDELHQMVQVLRVSGGTADALAPQPQPQLSEVPALIAESGLDVDCRIDVALDGPLSPVRSSAVQAAVYRTVQESLTNVRKHAPGADVRVEVYAAGRRLHVEIRNGPPAPGRPPLDVPSSGYGHVGLRERARLLGGTFAAYPTADGGYLVRVTYPVQAAL
ncbi:two-component sensor histidine kinase [Streptomyces sp. WAC 01529]|uniref:sensor histidine kinase n=1 Tax=Streptomyces sp. WAC 01529 TaxID=2203205 RepID=UPI000F6C7C59|nr:histidine kinase [Streptomyces sp. WAC 01529]AZM54126.1 two-component sensor histidine kinase [Streptomyces sp. WAC 01529]